MFKIFTLIALFFSCEIAVLWGSNDHLLDYIQGSKFNQVAFGKSQRRVFHIIRTIDENNQKNRRAVYIFGGSSTREFFDLENRINQRIHSDRYAGIHVCATSSQGLVDTLRLVEHIDVPGSLVVMGISPKKFWSEDRSYLTLSELLYGKYLKYPLKSDAVTALYEHEIAHGAFSRLSLFPPALNTGIYLIKDHVLEQIREVKLHGIAAYRLYDRSISEQHVKNYVRRLDTEGLMELEQKYAAEYMQHVDKNLAMNIKVMEKIIEVVRSKRLKLVLFDVPLNPLVAKLYTQQYRDYQDAINSLDQFRVHFAEESEPSLFHDTSHLNPDGKQYYLGYMMRGLNVAMAL